jgi:signal transduction histidine kinase
LVPNFRSFSLIAALHKEQNCDADHSLAPPSVIKLTLRSPTAKANAAGANCVGSHMLSIRVARQIVQPITATRADLFDVPSEQLIARARLILCLFSLLMLYFEPTQFVPTAVTSFTIFLAYSAFAVVLVALTRDRFLSSTASQFIHIVDLAVISALLFVTNERADPSFFALFTFALLAATLRWQWPAVVTTAAILALALLIDTVADQIFSAPPPPDNDLHTAIIRAAYLLIIGGMLAYVSAFGERNRDRFAQLARWPARKPGEELAPSLPQILAHSANVTEAPQVMVVWEEAEEPYVFLASCCGGSYHEQREGAGTFGTLVAPELSTAVFLTRNVSSGVVMLSTGLARIKAPVIDTDLIKRFSVKSVVSAPFSGTSCTGRIFICNCSHLSDDHLLLSEIIALRVGTALDRHAHQQHEKQAITRQAKMHLTRDVHDGTLQTLTAATLQLHLAENSAGRDRRSRLTLVKRLLASEQCRLRKWVEEVRPRLPACNGQAMLRSELQQRLDEAAEHWNCTTSLSVVPPDAKVPEPLTGQLSFMLAEAVANAVRHGAASSIDVLVEKTDSQLLINIRDNGKGFDGPPVACEEQELVVLDRGPVSLGERVGALRGCLTVATSSTGAQLTIQVPVS